MQSRRWVLSVVLYSLAVSIKMNVLLMAPGVLAVLVKARADACVCACVCLRPLLGSAGSEPGPPATWPHARMPPDADTPAVA